MDPGLDPILFLLTVFLERKHLKFWDRILDQITGILDCRRGECAISSMWPLTLGPGVRTSRYHARQPLGSVTLGKLGGGGNKEHVAGQELK